MEKQINSVNLTLSQDEAKWLLSAIDTHVRAKGINQAGNSFAMASKINQALQQSAVLGAGAPSPFKEDKADET